MYFTSEPQWQKDLIRELAKKYGLDIRVVRTMVYYPYLFTKRVIKDPHDNTPIRHRYLGCFNIKYHSIKPPKEENETKVEENS